MAGMVSAPTLFDVPIVDLDYVPDDARLFNLYDISSNYMDNDLLSYINRLGTTVWNSIEKAEKEESWKPCIAEFINWRKNCIQSLESALEGIFPGRWDLQYNGGDILDTPRDSAMLDLYEAKDYTSGITHEDFECRYITCYIHFPEILITNNTGVQWTILDYYVRIVFNNKMGVRSINGFRATKTPVEYTEHYTFSHSRVGDCSFVDFCFGHTDLDILVGDLLMGNYNAIGIELFLQNLTDYLSWESKEGVPFYTISNLIQLREGNGVAVVFPDSLASVIASSIISGEEDITLHIATNGYIPEAVVTVNMKLIDVVTKYTPESQLFPLDTISFTSIYPSNGMDEARIESINSKWQLTPIFKFKGQDVTMKIVREKKEEKEECRRYANVCLVSSVARKLEDKINRFVYDYSWSGFRKKGLPKV